MDYGAAWYDRSAGGRRCGASDRLSDVPARERHLIRMARRAARDRPVAVPDPGPPDGPRSG
jgi:hypothetical protein